MKGRHTVDMARTHSVNSLHFGSLPRAGGWRFLVPQRGFEVTRFSRQRGRAVLRGSSVGLEDGRLWSLRYLIELDGAWRARNATIEDDLGHRLVVEADGVGNWLINGKRQRSVQGCLDLDLEASLVTNMAAVRRLGLVPGERAEAPACYIRHRGLKVERLEQHYARLKDAGGLLRFDYESPRFDYRACLRFAPDGLVVDYPHIGVRETPP